MDGQALPGCGHAERALQASWWQEHGAAHAGGPRAQQAGKLETRALFAGSQGGTVTRAGGNTCGPQSARLDLKPPAVPTLFAGSQGGTVTRAGGNTCGPQSARLDLKPPAVPRSDTDHRTIYLTGIDANGKIARASARRRFRTPPPARARASASLSWAVV